MSQLCIEFAGRILYAVSFINDNVMPTHFAEFWPIMFVHEVLICCHEDIKILLQNLFPVSKPCVVSTSET